MGGSALLWIAVLWKGGEKKGGRRGEGQVGASHLMMSAWERRVKVRREALKGRRGIEAGGRT